MGARNASGSQAPIPDVSLVSVPGLHLAVVSSLIGWGTLTESGVDHCRPRAGLCGSEYWVVARDCRGCFWLHPVERLSMLSRGDAHRLAHKATAASLDLPWCVWLVCFAIRSLRQLLTKIGFSCASRNHVLQTSASRIACTQFITTIQTGGRWGCSSFMENEGDSENLVSLQGPITPVLPNGSSFQQLKCHTNGRLS